jgi:hypothetical protein
MSLLGPTAYKQPPCPYISIARYSTAAIQAHGRRQILDGALKLFGNVPSLIIVVASETVRLCLIATGRCLPRGGVLIFSGQEGAVGVAMKAEYVCL